VAICNPKNNMINKIVMKKRKNQPKVKMNLSIDKDFYGLLQENARKDYMRVSTWVKQFLMRNLLEKNNSDSKSQAKNGNHMEL
jgi:hypothetical protein